MEIWAAIIILTIAVLALKADSKNIHGEEDGQR